VECVADGSETSACDAAANALQQASALQVRERERLIMRQREKAFGGIIRVAVSMRRNFDKRADMIFGDAIEQGEEVRVRGVLAEQRRASHPSRCPRQ
jgi:hypothetical protein